MWPHRSARIGCRRFGELRGQIFLVRRVIPNRAICANIEVRLSVREVLLALPMLSMPWRRVTLGRLAGKLKKAPQSEFSARLAQSLHRDGREAGARPHY